MPGRGTSICETQGMGGRTTVTLLRLADACATCMDSVRSAASLRGPSSVEQYDLHFTRLEMVAVQSVKAAAMGGAGLALTERRYSRRRKRH